MQVKAWSNEIREASGHAFDFWTALTDTEAMLTDEHAAASYGLPVLVYKGTAYGPGDLTLSEPLTILPTTGVAAADAIRAAGWAVRLYSEEQGR